MSKQKKIALSSLMVALLLVGTMGMTMLAMAVETRATSTVQLSTSTISAVGSYKTKTGTGKITMFGQNNSTSSGKMAFVIQSPNDAAEESKVIAAGKTYDGLSARSYGPGQYRPYLERDDIYKPVSGSGYIYFS